MDNDENMFRYSGHRLYAEVSLNLLPKAVSMVKDYLASRLYSDEEKQEDPMDFMDKTLKSMPDAMARQANLNMLLMKRQMALQAHERAAAEIEAIPEGEAYQGAINITRGYRPGNVAELRVEKNGEGRATIELYFGSQVGDETRPLRWMQYDALLAKAEKAGFTVDRGSMDTEVLEFAADQDSYFRIAIEESMSAFDWSELESAVNFLWPEQLPEDVRAKLGK